MTARSNVIIPLAFPVPQRDAEGRERAITQLTLWRPRTKHAKRLAIAIGPELLKGFLADTPDDKIDMPAMATDLVAALASADRLEALTEIIADMCREDAAVIDDLDLVDLVEVGKAFADFFPALQSFMPHSSAPPSPDFTDGNPAQ